MEVKKDRRKVSLPPVRITEMEMLEVKEAAEKLGLTVTEFIRYCIAEQLNGGK